MKTSYCKKYHKHTHFLLFFSVIFICFGSNARAQQIPEGIIIFPINCVRYLYDISGNCIQISPLKRILKPIDFEEVKPQGSPSAGDDEKEFAQIIKGESTIDVYPNPTRGELFVEINGDEDLQSKASISVFTANGKLVFEIPKPLTQKNIIDLTGQVTGNYLIVVKLDDETITYKIALRK